MKVVYIDWESILDLLNLLEEDLHLRGGRDDEDGFHYQWRRHNVLEGKILLRQE
jgi:hypothetical protein